MEDLCEHSNEPSGSLKYSRFLTRLGTVSFSIKILLHMVGWLVGWFMGVCVCVCACVHERERERA